MSVGVSAVAKSNEEQERAEVTLIVLYVAWRERLSMSVDADAVVREQPEHLRAFFMERLQHYRQLSVSLPDNNVPEYARKDGKLKNSAVPDMFACRGPDFTRAG